MTIPTEQADALLAKLHSALEQLKEADAAARMALAAQEEARHAVAVTVNRLKFARRGAR